MGATIVFFPVVPCVVVLAKSIVRCPGQYEQAGATKGSTTGATTGGTRHSEATRTVTSTAECARGQGIPAAVSRERSMITAFEWICDTRLSVTPSTDPISARVMPSS